MGNGGRGAWITYVASWHTAPIQVVNNGTSIGSLCNTKYNDLDVV